MATESDLVEYDVFISYSRADKETALSILHNIEDRGKNAWLDQDDIHHGVDFLDEIYEGIEKSENFVFMISPDSVKSEVCKLELDYALELNKRIVPILARTTPTDTVDERIATINWIITENEDWDKVCDDLFNVLNTDVAHVKLHTILLREALAWYKQKKPNSMVLRGRRLVEANEWLEDSEDKEPKVTKLHRKFVRAGQKHRTKTQARLISGVSIALLVSIGLAIYAFYERGVSAERAAIAESRQIAMTAANLEEKNPGLSSLLAIKAARIYETKSALAELLSQTFEWQDAHAFLPIENAFETVFSADGKYLIVLATNTEVWDVETIEKVTAIEQYFTNIALWDSTHVFVQTDSMLQILAIPSLKSVASFPIKYMPYTWAVNGKHNRIAVLFDDAFEVIDYQTKQTKKIAIPSFRFPANNLKFKFDDEGKLAILYRDTFFRYDVDADSVIYKAVPDLTKKSRSWQSLSHSDKYMICFDDAQTAHLLDVDSVKFIATGYKNTNPQATLNLTYNQTQNCFVSGESSSKILLHFPPPSYPTNIGFDDKESIKDVSFNPAGTKLAVTYEGGTVIIFNVPIVHIDKGKLYLQELGDTSATGELTFKEYILKATGKTMPVSGSTITKSQLFYGADEIEVQYADPTKNKTIDISGFGTMEQTLISRNQKLFFYTNFDTSTNSADLFIYDLQSQKAIASNTIKNYTSSGAYTFSRDDSTVIFYTAKPEPMYVQWDIHTNSLDTIVQTLGAEELDNYYEFTYSHDKQLLAVSTSEELIVYDVETNEAIAMERLGKFVYMIEFHPTLPRLYGRLGSSEIVVWDLENGMQIGSHYRVSDAHLDEWKFDWDNEVLWTLDQNGTVRQTELNFENQIDMLLRKVVRDFTPEEWARYFPEQEYEPLR